MVTLLGPITCVEILPSRAQTELAFLRSGASVLSQVMQLWSPTQEPRRINELMCVTGVLCKEGRGLALHLFGLPLDKCSLSISMGQVSG